MQKSMKLTKDLAAVMAALAMVCSVVGGAHAATEFVQNGSFETLTNGGGQLGYNTTATGWSLANPPGYTFVFTPGEQYSTGVTSQFGSFALWGPGTAGGNVANGMPASSPDGGNFIAQDADYQSSAIVQTITGLTPGAYYTLNFDWAAAQQESYTGATFDYWTAALGNQSFSTSTYDLPNHGFSGWMQQSFTYQATSASEVLSFLSTGGPNPFSNNSVPPFALLDGVSLQVTPEPSSFVTMAVGLLCLGGILVYRRQFKKSAAILKG
jgi:hypothetical protein